MRTTTRSAISCLAVAWVAGVVGWGMRAGMTLYVSADGISAARWRRAAEDRLRLPIEWSSADGAPPLLPARGQVILREDEALVNGLAVIPGAFGAGPLEVGVAFVPQTFLRYPKLGRPLIPGWPGAGESQIQRANAVDLYLGVPDPRAGQLEGLRLRWDESLTAFCGDLPEPLFPGKKARLSPGDDGFHRLRAVVDGRHVVVHVNGVTMLDFHTTRALAGCIGLGTDEGVITLRQLDVRAPT